MIETVNLVKEFGGFRALDGLGLHAPAGLVYGLVGPNGAGKTTALHHIAGVMRPTSGEVSVGGCQVFEHPEVKERIAYIPSDFYYYRQARIRDMRGLTELQDGFAKVQVAFEDEGAPLPCGIDVVSESAQGKLRTLVVRGAADEVEAAFAAAGASFVNVLPLSLEEIFIYEIGALSPP